MTRTIIAQSQCSLYSRKYLKSISTKPCVAIREITNCYTMCSPGSEDPIPQKQRSQLLSDLDHDEISGLVFVDYKVFDILLSKLKAYGVTSRELLLLKKCLRGRRSAVVNDGV